MVVCEFIYVNFLLHPFEFLIIIVQDPATILDLAFGLLSSSMRGGAGRRMFIYDEI